MDIEHKLYIYLGNEFKKARLNGKVSIKDLARYINRSVKTLYKFERGEIQSYYLLLQYTDIFKIDLERIIKNYGN